LVSRETNLSENILNQILEKMNDKLFRRTELGNAEIRERALPLNKFEQTLLISVDGEISTLALSKLFQSTEIADFDAALRNLQKKVLIEEVPNAFVQEELQADLLRSSIEEFDSENFFSASLRPMQQGSGLVVDTHANKMKSVNLKKRDFSIHESFELSLGLDDEVKDRKSKRLKSKLVQVFPDPGKPKKRKRSKRKVVEISESKWKMRAYIALIATGVLLALFSLMQ
jgi:5-carboxymethyl-2-hydroxymuconate isomerase